MRCSSLAAALLLAAPSAMAETSLDLPPRVAAGLEAARSPADIAGLVRRHPALAATLMADAAVLGIASPASVLGHLLSARTECAALRPLVQAAAEAAPPEADIAATAAIAALGMPLPACAPAAIAGAVVDGLEAAGLTAALLDAEITEIAAGLSGVVPDRMAEIAAAIAAATDTDSDTAESVLDAVGAGIETADIPPAAAQALARVPIAFPEMPSEAQNNPSAN